MYYARLLLWCQILRFFVRKYFKLQKQTIFTFVKHILKLQKQAIFILDMLSMLIIV